MNEVTRYFSEKLKFLRKERGLTQKELGEKIGVKHNTVSGYENGVNEPEQDILYKLATVLGVNINEFFPSPTNLTPITSKTIQIPVLGSIACGEPILAEENIAEYREIFADNLPSGDLFFLQAKGDSMEPRIPDGSYVLIRQQPDVENGQIAAVLVNGDTEATLKRVRKLGDDSVLLEAINEEYAPYLINENNPAKIIGKAVKVEIEL
ncbi:TPA: LexA family protein [Streptococcus suis]